VGVEGVLSWLVRFLHVFGAALWVGGYAVLALAVVPLMARRPSETLLEGALLATRVLSNAGALTIVAGLFLVAQTRGYGSLLGGEWGAIVIACIVLAIALMGVGDAGLRPALRRVNDGGAGAVGAARRWALAGLITGGLAIALMTRALYARS
jgi:putative copper export protein